MRRARSGSVPRPCCSALADADDSGVVGSVIILGKRIECFVSRTYAHRWNRLGSSAVRACPADLRSEEGAAELGNRVVDSVGGIDVLVNNAGAATGPIPTLERLDSSWLADLEMNLLSAVRLDRVLVPGMVERGSGVVVHVSSIASQLPPPAEASYAAAGGTERLQSRVGDGTGGARRTRGVCSTGLRRHRGSGCAPAANGRQSGHRRQRRRAADRWTI